MAPSGKTLTDVLYLQRFHQISHCASVNCLLQNIKTHSVVLFSAVNPSMGGKSHVRFRITIEILNLRWDFIRTYTYDSVRKDLSWDLVARVAWSAYLIIVIIILLRRVCRIQWRRRKRWRERGLIFRADESFLMLNWLTCSVIDHRCLFLEPFCWKVA